MFKKILVPLDGSHLAEAALPLARDLAQGFKAELVLLRVANRMHLVYPISNMTMYGELLEGDRHACRAYLDDIAKDLRTAGLEVACRVDDGVAAEAIIDFAALDHVDLIVMSTHGRSGMKRWLLGSTADRVLHGASVPVLLVRSVEQTQTAPQARDHASA